MLNGGKTISLKLLKVRNFQWWTHLDSQKPGFLRPRAGSGEVDPRKYPVSDHRCWSPLMSVGIAKWNEAQPTLI